LPKATGDVTPEEGIGRDGYLRSAADRTAVGPCHMNRHRRSTDR